MFKCRSSSIERHLPLKVVIHRRLSSIKGCLPSKVVLHRRSSSIKGPLPLKDVFHRRLSSIKGRLPSKVVQHQSSSSIEGRLPSKDVFHRRLSSIEGRLLPPSYPKGESRIKAWSFRQSEPSKKRPEIQSDRNLHIGPVLTLSALAINVEQILNKETRL